MPSPPIGPALSPPSDRSEHQLLHGDSQTSFEHARRPSLVSVTQKTQQQRQRSAVFFAFMCFGLASWIMTNGEQNGRT